MAYVGWQGGGRDVSFHRTGQIIANTIYLNHSTSVWTIERTNRRWLGVFEAGPIVPCRYSCMYIQSKEALRFKKDSILPLHFVFRAPSIKYFQGMTED